HGDDRRRADGVDARAGTGGRAAGRTGGRHPDLPRARCGQRPRGAALVVQCGAAAYDRGVTEEDRPARCALDRQGAADRDVPAPGLYPEGGDPRAAGAAQPAAGPACGHNRWRHRARTYLRAGGYPVAAGVAAVRAALVAGSPLTRGAPASLTDALARSQRQEAALRAELAQLDAALRTRTQTVEAIQRLMTVPGIGPLTATMRYAWI